MRIHLLKVPALVILATTLSSCASVGTTEPDASTSFFITSQNPGNGANLGGVEGADAYCNTLAIAAGITGKSWKAYLSTDTEDARDRIGSGPWQNANGVTVATSVDDLHSDNNALTKENSISEAGDVIAGRGDTPNRHDVLTGSNADGTASGASCDNWTSSGTGSATVGHHDRTGGGDDPTSWNSAHGSKGCGLEDLRGTGGDGLYYCFASN